MWEYQYYPPSTELYHHGILGMHWGKRNGPPYPLSGSAHSPSEKKAGWRKSLKLEKKQNAAQAKVDKRKAKIDMAQARAVTKQERYNARANARVDNKIAKNKASGNNKKAEILETKQKYDKQYQREYIKSLNQGYEQYKRNELVYKQMKVDAITDPKLKRTSKYKSAGKDYIEQKYYQTMFSLYYGPGTGSTMLVNNYTRENNVKIQKELARKQKDAVNEVKDKYR